MASVAVIDSVSRRKHARRTSSREGVMMAMEVSEVMI